MRDRTSWALVLVLAFAVLQLGPARVVAGPLATGGFHTCAIAIGGVVKCWGSNSHGQLGDGTRIDRATPVDVIGLGAGAISVTAGDLHTCAVLGNGGVKCWGSNRHGRLGDGSTIDRPTPVTVSGYATGVSDVAAGGAHTCAVTAGGAAQCWGSNATSALGSFGSDSATPRQVTNLTSGALRLNAGLFGTCAVTNAGAALCWGFAGNTGGPSSAPQPVSGFSSATEGVSVANRGGCALTTGGGVRCFGDGRYGLGDGVTTNFVTTPVQVTGLASGALAIESGGDDAFPSIDASSSFHCASLLTGGVRCWGSNGDGQLGDGTNVNRASPVTVLGLTGSVRALSVGGLHACALTEAGKLYCWGSNTHGQLGNGQVSRAVRPTAVVGFASAVNVLSAGASQTCALTASGGAKCWGDNAFGQLGDGTTTPRTTPADVAGIATGATTIDVSGQHGCAIVSGGIRCWGTGFLGNNTTTPSSTPVVVSGVASPTAITVDRGLSCAISASQGVYCWGDNSSGRVGDGCSGSCDRLVPTRVFGGLTSATAISAGPSSTFALTPGDGTGLKCWGSSTNLTCFLGGPGDVFNAPANLIRVSAGGGFASIQAVAEHTCLLTGAGAVSCAGTNSFGELGDATNTARRTSFAPVTGLTGGLATIETGSAHACALTSAGAAWCWGRNTYGQLGNGNSADSNVPVQVADLPAPLTALALGAGHTCGRTAAGQVYCWGSNRRGQLGTGQASFSNVAVPVVGDFFSSTQGSGLVVTGTLTTPGDAADFAGTSVAVGRDIVVVGAPDAAGGGVSVGEVYVYTGVQAAARAEAARTGDPVAKAVSAPDAILRIASGGGQIGDKFGRSVDVSNNGQTIVVGAPGRDGGRGGMLVFEKPPGGWSSTVFPVETIVPPTAQAGDAFGQSVALSNAGTLIVGSPGMDASGQADAGAVMVYRRSGGFGSFAPSQTILPAALEAGARFGDAVAAQGPVLLVGAPGRDGPAGVDQGAAELLREEAGSYAAKTVVRAAGGNIGDKFGAAVDVNDDMFGVGAPGRDRGTTPNTGAGYLFETDTVGDAVVPRAVLVDASGTADSQLGTSIEVARDSALAGAPGDDVGFNPNQGSAPVYNAPGGWTSGERQPNGRIVDAEGAPGDAFGTALARRGLAAAVGIPGKDSVGAIAAKGSAEDQGSAIAYAEDAPLFRDSLETRRGAHEACVYPRIAIPDNTFPSGIFSDLTIAATGGALARDVNVAVSIDHTYVSDLRLRLEHLPSGRSVLLYAPSSCPLDNMRTVFDDEGIEGPSGRACAASTLAVSGHVTPSEWLQGFAGVASAGPWRLTVADAAAADVGQLIGFCVDVLQ